MNALYLRAQSILQRMTPEEKIGQMNQITPSIVGGFDVSFEELIEMLTDGRITQDKFQAILSGAKRDFREDDIRDGRIGALILNDREKADELQRIAVEESRLGIPLLVGFDVIHGMNTIFPIPLAEACTFDPDTWEQSAAIAAREAREHGIAWLFAPMLDLARDARWGRVSESFGEDPCLGARYARAKILGIQGPRREDGTLAPNHAAACVKHFVGYGGAEGGRDYNTVSLSGSTLFNCCLPPFRSALEAGALTAMAGFHDLNGIPCTVNSFLLRRILKEQLGLEGLVTSDANAVAECVSHGVCRDRADAALQSVNAGVDMDMGSGCFEEALLRALRDGSLSPEVVDEAVLRILYTKLALGLFERPYSLPLSGDAPSSEHLEAARDCARKSIVLLKNDGTLPLRRDASILLTGALADDGAEALGAWAITGNPAHAVTLRDALEGRAAKLEYIPCCGPQGEIDPGELARVEACAPGADVIVAVVGESASMSGEASSRADITLPGPQRAFLTRLLSLGRPLVVCLMNGRPLELSWESEQLPVLMECWQLGVQMGPAVADVLYGDVSPSGKLTATFPARSGQCPMYYSHPSTGRPGSRSKFSSRYLDTPVEPVFPFGYGLSYTTFAYSRPEVELGPDTVTIHCILKNTGEQTGTEVAQLYIQDATASLVRPVRELKDFCRVTLKPGQQRVVTFVVAKSLLGFYDNEGSYRMEPGLMRAWIGGSSEAGLSLEFTL